MLLLFFLLLHSYSPSIQPVTPLSCVVLSEEANLELNTLPLAGSLRRPHTTDIYKGATKERRKRHSWRCSVKISRRITTVMDQPRISSFWKKRRRSSIKSKRRLSPERNVHSRDQCSQIHPASHWDLILPGEKSWKGTQGCLKRPNRSLTTSSPTGYSVLEHKIDDFRPRTSGSKRHKMLPSPIGSFNEEEQQLPHLLRRPSTNFRTENSPPSHSKASGWLRRCVSATFRHPRRPSASFQSHDDASFHVDYLTSPIPGIGIEPPIIPDNLTSGAAARAAAATQNEILECVRNLRLTEPKIRRDSESGIGIEMRERGEESIDIPIPRKGQ